jgi:hypothetical protein
MPLICYICGKLFESTKPYLAHLRLVHAKHYTGCTVQCGQDGCHRIFDNFRGLKRHLEVSLANTCCGLIFENTDPENVCYENIYTGKTIENNTTDTDKPNLGTLTASFMRLLGQLECKANIAHANIQAIVDNMHGFVEDMTSYCTYEVSDLLADLNVVPHTNLA